VDSNGVDKTEHILQYLLLSLTDR